jgi:hypothetical protein
MMMTTSVEIEPQPDHNPDEPDHRNEDHKILFIKGGKETNTTSRGIRRQAKRLG